MKVTFTISRYTPGEDSEPRFQSYEIETTEGMVVLEALHRIHDHQDQTLAYRYSCRGAICGSCAMRINGTESLACKTQISSVAEDGGTVTLEPLANLEVIKDLVVDQDPFFDEMARKAPWLEAAEPPDVDEPIDYGEGLSTQELDEWHRSNYCIKCQACFSGCPKRAENPDFIGPANCVEILKHVFDFRDDERENRLAEAGEPGGVWDCDKHAVCVKVCPKDIRPMRAIMMMRKKLESGDEGEG